MLTVKNLRKAYGERTLFEEVSFTINYGEKIAIVGPNGAGKSTIFKIILKQLDPDEGTVTRDEWTTVGFLPQESEPVGDETVLEVATGKAGEIEKLEKELERLEGEGMVDVPEYYEAQGKYEALTDVKLEAKAKKMLRGLAFKESDFDRPAKEMSGGWVMRAHLARLLAMEPDLLMLDEPTNHLDLYSLVWFQDYLKRTDSAVLMISHDRGFMDSLAENIFDVGEGKLVSYKGNYSHFLKERSKRYDNQMSAYKNQQKQIQDIQGFINKFKNVGSKASQVKNRQGMLEKIDKLPKPRGMKKGFRFNFPQPVRSGQRVITLEDVSKSYDDLTIYRHLQLTIERGERTVLVGPNGAGKSTLLKVLAGVLDFEEGKRIVGHNAEIGYFSQHRLEGMDPQNTVLEEVCKVAPEMREDEVRGVLGSFLFRKEEVYKKCEVLSGGEKSRVNLVKFLVNPPNLLLMDEPTTHLDIQSIEALITGLERYEGTLVFISHDVYFIKRLAEKVLHIANGSVSPYAGGYDYYLEKSGGILDEQAALLAG